MGNNAGTTDGGRGLARAILVGLVLAITLFVLFASSPRFGSSSAQVPLLDDTHTPTRSPSSGSPSPTQSSASPTPTQSSASPSPTQSSASPSPTQSSASPSPTPSESTPPPVVGYSTRTTLDYRNKTFVGKANSDEASCRNGRFVVLKKKRPGKDRKVGTDITNREGAYKIPKRKADGTYYTVAFKKTFTNTSGQETTCTRDRSPNEKV